MEENKEKTMQDKLIESSENAINSLLENGIQNEELETLCKLTKIHKYARQEKHWEKEENDMRYNNYGYRGEQEMDDMYMNYQAYSEGREQYNRGNYGAKQDTLMSLEYMLKSMVEFMNMLKQDATSQEEMNLIQQYTRKISEM